MKRKKPKIVKWILRIILGLAGLLALVIIAFYLFRGLIMEKVVDRVNAAQEGEVIIGKINLRPFMDFPNVSLQLIDLQYLPPQENMDIYDTIPIVQLEDLFVSLDVAKLIKGSYLISGVRIMNGQVNYLVDADSLSNLEKALGFRFGEETDEPTAEQDSSLLALTLNSLKIRNLSIHYISLPDSVDINLKINGLESNFDYQPAYIDAAVMLHADLLSANIKDISLDKTRSVSFSTSVNYDQQLKTVLLDRSLMDLNDILLELEGEANFASGTLDLNFLAKNRGIDLLNFLMNGVLDMEDLEQTGNGSINLSGDIFGSFKDNIPEVNVWFDASDLGFMIHSLNQSVSNIGFSGYFTNGKKSDFNLNRTPI